MSAVESEPTAPGKSDGAEPPVSRAPESGKPETSEGEPVAVPVEAGAEATRDAELLPNEKDLANMLRQERMRAVR